MLFKSRYGIRTLFWNIAAMMLLSTKKYTGFTILSCLIRFSFMSVTVHSNANIPPPRSSPVLKGYKWRNQATADSTVVTLHCNSTWFTLTAENCKNCSTPSTQHLQLHYLQGLCCLIKIMRKNLVNVLEKLLRCCYRKLNFLQNFTFQN